ncbi:PREDICTED: uncharacterized protein LOC105564345 isoform X1 [Vollenhovia emeryi]|uniref:uncharacterized protein LOC105564345 isoform X1 n=1 Tax=Vollenhovia emeryi TaxID=411798 RepID=UPI0005F3CBCE|nr:PREDICTED: uncharacterized protein LOC105564345 isoform X1 [Vollenhovia emeryi]
MLSSSRAFPPILAVALVVCIGVAHGIRCYQCGQYNEGVGSITPCINYTAHMLKECPHSDEWCIKYVSEGSTVRDCVPHCVEKGECDIVCRKKTKNKKVNGHDLFSRGRSRVPRAVSATLNPRGSARKFLGAALGRPMAGGVPWPAGPIDEIYSG